MHDVKTGNHWGLVALNMYCWRCLVCYFKNIGLVFHKEKCNNKDWKVWMRDAAAAFLSYSVLQMQPGAGCDASNSS